MKTDICSNSTIGDSATLTDSRDNKTYTVKKLADSKCWMTQNLALTGPRTLTTIDSDVNSNFTLPNIDTGTWCADYSSACFNQSKVQYDSRYGAYYNWYTATAGEGVYETKNALTTSSICPKNWRLPTRGETNVLFRSIDNNYDNALSSSGNYPGFLLAGRVFQNSSPTSPMYASAKKQTHAPQTNTDFSHPTKLKN